MDGSKLIEPGFRGVSCGDTSRSEILALSHFFICSHYVGEARRFSKVMAMDKLRPASVYDFSLHIRTLGLIEVQLIELVLIV